MKKSALMCSLWLMCAVAVTVPTTIPVYAKPHTPARGSGERTQIMNSLRRVLGSGRHKAIVVPLHFKVESGWAYVSGGFSYAKGARLEPEWREGSGTNFSALLRRESGKWRVKRRVYHGDVVAPDFIRAFPQAPRAIFQ